MGKNDKVWALPKSNVYIKFLLKDYADAGGECMAAGGALDSKAFASKLRGTNSEMLHRPGIWPSLTSCSLLALAQVLEKVEFKAPRRVLEVEHLQKVRDFLEKYKKEIRAVNSNTAGRTRKKETAKAAHTLVSKGFAKHKQLLPVLAQTMRLGARLYVGSFALYEAIAGCSNPKALKEGMAWQGEGQAVDAPADLYKTFRKKGTIEAFANIVAKMAPQYVQGRADKENKKHKSNAYSPGGEDASDTAEEEESEEEDKSTSDEEVDSNDESSESKQKKKKKSSKKQIKDKKKNKKSSSKKNKDSKKETKKDQEKKKKDKKKGKKSKKNDDSDNDQSDESEKVTKATKTKSMKVKKSAKKAQKNENSDNEQNDETEKVTKATKAKSAKKVKKSTKKVQQSTKKVNKAAKKEENDMEEYTQDENDEWERQCMAYAY
jgi:hypothetical protein